MSTFLKLRRGRLAPVYRAMMAAPSVTKWGLFAGMVAAVGYGDWVSGSEISFAVFYLVPVVYTTWFMGARAGLFAAVTSAVVWFIVEVSFSSEYATALVPLWNASVRLVYFSLGVGLATLVKRREFELARSVLQRARLLRGEAARRRRLERDLIEVTSREHTRMAQDLHDGLGQYVAAMAFHARMLAEDLRKEATPLAAQADNLVALIRRMNQITRHLDRALRVPEAKEGGLAEVIKSHAAEFSELTGVPCEVHAPGAPVIALDDFRTLMLFRIVQEACNNAVKHGNPSLVRIVMHVENQQLFLQVSDNGSPPGADSPGEGTGRESMQLRAKLIEAKLETGPSATGGYSVLCVLPLNGAARASAVTRHP